MSINRNILGAGDSDETESIFGSNTDRPGRQAKDRLTSFFPIVRVNEIKKSLR